MQRLRFFMDLSGNKELLDRYLVAFFASRSTPPEALPLVQRWARDIARSNKIVISGFHSPIERSVLDILLAHNCSVLVALSRSLYRKIPAHLQSAYAENRVLFLSLSDNDRSSFSSSQRRNWIVADLANEIVFAPYIAESQLSTLNYSLSHTSKHIIVLH